MLRVGLSGGIGSGKSTVARALARRGAVVIDADAIAREVVEPGEPGLAAVVERFGPGVLDAEGRLDRPKLAALVFGDAAARADLNAIVHPRVALETARRAAAAPPDAVVVIDVPLLVEAARSGYDLVVIVEAPEAVRLERLVARGMSPDDARKRMGAQASDADRRKVADVVLDNSASEADLERQIDALWGQLTASLRADGPGQAVTPRRYDALMAKFELVSDFAPAGDQPAAITSLCEGLAAGERFQTLLGITGSGKSFTIAGVIAAAQRPTLVLAPNKSLAAQLTSEFREFFPKNRVEYFVSYYDYYQPEAYIPTTDTYIEKDSSINDEIDRLRHSATSGLLSRRDVIIVASVSAIYGLGAPDEYAHQLLTVSVGEERDQRSILSRMVDMGYERNDLNFVRNKFRVRGDTIEVFPAYEERATRIQLFGDEIERIVSVDPVTGEVVEDLEKLVMFPASHYVVSKTRMERAIAQIEDELKARLAVLEGSGKLLEAQRLRMRTTYDLEMLREVGVCSGIENYSRHLDGRSAGQMPYTLLDYFPDDFLMVIDESHVAVPQLHGQYEGDRSRKDTLVEHGFRLPSAMDNRPLRFEEFTEKVGQVIFMSATPSNFEMEVSSRVVEQIVRPTGLMDPQVVVRPTKGQIDDLVAEIRAREEADERVLVTTLTKKMSEDLTEYLLELGIRVRYLHSDIDTIQRVEILRGLRLGEFDVLVGINLLREGLDLPEVSLVAILDADKEGFLRSETSLIQTMGRAARNVAGQVVMYADQVTDSMRKAISETERRRGLQAAYNEEHGIDPQTIRKKVTDILEMIRGRTDEAPLPAKGRRRMTARENARRQEILEMPHDELGRLIQTLEEEMHEAAAELRFEYAARLRDEISDLKRELREAG